MRCLSFLSASCAFFLAGCTASLTNLTPDVVVSAADAHHAICANVEKDSFVVTSSIDVDLLVDGARHPMSGSGTGTWSRSHPLSGPGTIDYAFDLKWTYLMLFFPVTERARYPQSGNYHLGVTPLPAGCSADGWCQQISGTTRHLRDVWGSGPQDVYAVAASDALLHFDGQQWHVQGNSRLGSTRVNGVWGSGPPEQESMLAVVGWAGAVLGLQEPGTTWSVLFSGTDPTSDDEIGPGSLHDIWGSGPRDIYIVAELGSISRYQPVGVAYRFRYQASGTRENLWGVWGSGPADVFSVGSNGTILHSDGNAWTSQVSGTNQTLFAVWGSGPSEVFAVGANGTILRYDGVQWHSMPSPANVNLKGVWGTRSDDVYAVGENGTVLHFDGSSWHQQASGTQANLEAVWGIAEACGTVVFAVGQGGTILRR